MSPAITADPSFAEPTAISMAPPSLSSNVVLRFGCSDLTKRDLTSNSDTFIVVYLTEVDSEQREIGRTDTAVNKVSVLFGTKMNVEYRCEEMQRLHLHVYDRDSPSEDLSKHDKLGCAEVTLVELMTSKCQSVTLPLQQPATEHISGLKGSVTISAEVLSSCTDKVTFQLGADKLDNTDGWFSKSDAYVSIQRRLEDGTAINVWTSNYIKNSLNPRWKEATVSLRSLCNGDLTKVLHFYIWDYEADGSDQFIGKCSMTAGEFVAGERLSIDIINNDKKGKKKYVNSGVLRVLSIQRHEA